MNKLFVVNKEDNVGVALQDLKAGYSENEVVLKEDVAFGHKVALCDLRAGDSLIKYGNEIGRAKKDIKQGQHVHTHNLKSNLSKTTKLICENPENTYEYHKGNLTFNGYRRNNGKVATRNEIWIIPTVGCVNGTVRRLESIGQSITGDECDGVFAFGHPYGCSQLGDDQEYTREILASLINHPNAGGVLVVSLGCENTNVSELKRYIGGYDENRVKILVTQDLEDELEAGKTLLLELYDYVKEFKRQPISVDELVVAYKCGGSDAFSGITANMLCGKVNDRLTANGAKTILTETPEMFGAESILISRAENRFVCEDILDLINGFKQYFTSHGQGVDDNPSPGNKAGGITTLEEKSLGCVQKGGKSVITNVLRIGHTDLKNGLNLLMGPGNDIVSTTNLTAASAHVILFTTGRGTPLGAPVPTIKISSNTPLAKHKKNWIDFDSGVLLNGADRSKETERLLQLLLSVASGKQTKNETNGYREIAIFKNGVTL